MAQGRDQVGNQTKAGNQSDNKSGEDGLIAMTFFDLNKIFGAVLGTCLVLLVLNMVAHALFAPHLPSPPGYVIALPEKAGEAPAAAAKPEEVAPIAVRLASADVQRGQAVAKQCAACHTFEKGGPNRVGPNLFGILNRPKGEVAGFNYSAAMKGKGGNWSYEDLDHFLAGPKSFVPGTNMSFAGLPKAAQRADMIMYLRSLADNPAPLPTQAKAQ